MAMASHTAGHAPATTQRGNRFYALILRTLCILFGLRVLGQAVQCWAPQPFLPPFDAFQGSDLPYWLLLSTQLGLLAAMLGVTSRVSWGAARKSMRSARAFAWFGGVYMVGSLARIALGLSWSEAPAWFTAWIPAIFHVVLAAFALTLAAYHSRA
jgi:hypothetical protein